MEPAKAKFHQGLVEFKRGNYGEAFSLFTEATQHDPEFSDAFYHLGIIYHHQYDYVLASRYFEMAIRVNPDHLGARAQLGLLGKSDSGSAASSGPKHYSDSEFFVRLGEDQKEATANLIEAIETSGLAPKLERRGVLADQFFNVGGNFLILLFPALIPALFVAGTLEALGWAPFIPVMLTTAGICFSLQILFKNR